MTSASLNNFGRACIIALSGPAGCGKSTAAAWLELDYGFERLSFADPIRAFACELFPRWKDLDLTGPMKDILCRHYHATPREVLRTIGQHLRLYRESGLIDHLAGRVAERLEAGARGIVIDDLRMPAEAEWARAAGVQVVHVRRSGVVWSGEDETEIGPGDEPGDWHLQNPGNLACYHTMVRVLMAQIAPQGSGMARSDAKRVTLGAAHDHA